MTASHRTARRTSLLVASLLTAVALAGCGPESGPDTKTQSDARYLHLWEEFAKALESQQRPDGENSSVADINEAFGWTESSLATVTAQTDAGVCIVSTEGVHIALVYDESDGRLAALMSDGDTCSYDKSDAEIVAVMALDDPVEFDVTRDDDGLLDGASSVADQDAVVTRDARVAVKNAATFIEEAAARDVAAQPSAADIEEEFDYYDYDALPGGTTIQISWSKTAPNSSTDLGYDLCAEKPDGSWATWDSAAAKVADSGTSGGCPAPTETDD